MTQEEKSFFTLDAEHFGYFSEWLRRCYEDEKNPL